MSENMISIDRAMYIVENRVCGECDSSNSDWECSECDEALVLAIQGLKLLKEQQPKTGHWIDGWTCSNCFWMHEDDNGFALLTPYNYCPNCGAIMEDINCENNI